MRRRRKEKNKNQALEWISNNKKKKKKHFLDRSIFPAETVMYHARGIISNMNKRSLIDPFFLMLLVFLPTL